MQGSGGVDPSTRSSASARCMVSIASRSGWLVDDQLADHRIVVGRHDVAAMTCESNRTPKPPGTTSRSILPAKAGILCGFSALMRHSIAAPVCFDVFLTNASGLAAGNRESAA